MDEGKKKQTRKKKVFSTKIQAAADSTKLEAAPLKVVYISAPLKVETSPSNFRSLVQQFTGQGAVWPLDPNKISSYNLPLTQTPPLDHNNSSAVVVEDDHIRTELGKDNGLSSAHLYCQPLDQNYVANYDDNNDPVVLIDSHLLNTLSDDLHDFNTQLSGQVLDSYNMF